MRTATAPQARRQAWLVQQRVTGLRVFGTSIEKMLPVPFDAARIGSAPDCELAYLHATVSKRHGMLRETEEGLAFHEWPDPPPKNGSFCEGERRSRFQIVPGTWFALGGLELVAFSHESQQQRTVLGRYLGYGEAAQHAIDRLYYGITRDRHLALIGPDGACRALARVIHELRGELGASRLPAAHVDRSVRVAPNLATASAADQLSALQASGGRTFVIEASHLPRDPSAFLQMIAARTFDNRLLLLAYSDPAAMLGSSLRNEVIAIDVPGIAKRAAELPRLIQETIAEESSRLQAPGAVLLADDVGRLHRVKWSKDLLEIEECVSRLIACRLHKTTRKAATALGLKSGGTISAWASRYGFTIKR